MINNLNIQKDKNKKQISKYREWELRFKTKKQVNTLIDYNNWKRWRNSNNIIELIPQLSYNEFITLLEKEIDKQSFNNKNIEYYEKLLHRLEELKTKINDKIKFRYFNEKIEEALLKSSKKNNFNYLEEKIKENKTYNKIFQILDSKYIKTNLLSKNSDESYLSITTIEDNKEINNNLDWLLELLYQWKIDSSIHLMKVKNKKLKDIYRNNSDIEKYLKWKVVWIWAKQKIYNIYENLDYDTAILFIIKNFKSWNIENLEKIKKYLDTKKWNPENNIDTKLLRAIKIEIELLSQKNNNEQKIKEIINTLENSNQKSIILKSIAEIKHIMNTKNEYESLEYFNYLLLWWSKKTKNANKNYSKITQLNKIKQNISTVHKSKTRDFLISEIENKLNELEK